MNINNNFKWHKISGNAWEIGFKLGEIGKIDTHEHLIKSELWKTVTSYDNEDVITTLHRNTKSKFPSIYEEIKGLAKGLELPFEDVFLWNCRGDILSNTNDGCTTLQIPGETNYIAHNEDGFPFFLKKCFIAEFSPTNELSFISFCYPASIPGHTFGVNEKGLVKTVNNLRLKNVEPELPRMVIGRAIFKCQTLDDAISLIQNNSKTGGFNFSLTSKYDTRLIDIEFGNGKIAIEEVIETSIHSNHAIYSPLNKMDQIITNSSKDRYKRFLDIKKENTQIVPMNILRDIKGEGLPIFRADINDPDNENTVASAIFKVTKDSVEYSFYESNNVIPSYKGII
jgi:predicted choloylglycine hydrolase